MVGPPRLSPSLVTYTFRTVFTHLVNVTVTFSGITWSKSLFSFIIDLMTDSVTVCIIYTHIRFMRGKCGD